jgi:hypothetical protein
MTATMGEIADILLDLHNVQDPDASFAAQETAFKSVLERLSASGALSVTVDDETGEHQIDVGMLLTAIAGLQYYLIENLAEARAVGPEVIRFELREFASRLDASA